MFAHQVADQIINNVEIYTEYYQNCSHEILTKEHLKFMNFVSDLIVQSQKFHCGSIEKMWGAVINDGTNLSTDLFKGKFEVFHLPYKLCWFDFFVDTSETVKKLGALVSESKQNRKIIIPFEFVKVEGFVGWVFFPEYLVIEEGANNWTDYITPGFKETYRALEESEKFSIFKTLLQIAWGVNSVLVFLSCRNITTKTNQDFNKLNKKRKKAGKLPIFSYKTLLIKPTSKKKISIQNHLWNNRIHLARGHFKTYTEEAPLFGKIKGRFWWQPHVRGQNRDGVVMKDYKVIAN